MRDERCVYVVCGCGQTVCMMGRAGMGEPERELGRMMITAVSEGEDGDLKVIRVAGVSQCHPVGS